MADFIALALRAQDFTAAKAAVLAEACLHPYDRTAIAEARADYDAAREVERAYLTLI
jgi:hypothetical protein